MNRPGDIRRHARIELSRFTATDPDGRTHTVVRWCRPFQVLAIDGWSALQHTDQWMDVDGVEVTQHPLTGQLELQTHPPTPLTA